MHSWLLTTLRLACPVAAVSLPLLMLYGALVPWQVAEDALVEHRGSSKLLLGTSSYWHSGNGHQSETTSRTYLIIPYSLSTFNAVTVVSSQECIEEPLTPRITCRRKAGEARCSRSGVCGC